MDPNEVFMAHKHCSLLRFQAAALLVALIFCIETARAESYSEAALAGLNGISLVVEHLSEDAQNAGLTRERLEAIVELRLLRSGIAVLRPPVDQEGSPYLYIRVSALRLSKSSLFFYTVEVSLYQDVWIQRTGPLSKALIGGSASARTGTDERMGYVGREFFVGAVTEQVEAFVDKFALAYLRNKQKEEAVKAIDSEPTKQPASKPQASESTKSPALRPPAIEPAAPPSQVPSSSGVNKSHKEMP